MILNFIRKITKKFKLILLCVTLAFFIFLFLSLIFNSDKSPTLRKHQRKNVHELCVIVPFRDRLEELLEFVPHMVLIFEEQKISHHIFVIHQVDSLRFNRGALINIGFIHGTTNTDCDYIAMHDVDLLPLNKNISYAYPDDHAFHIASPNLHPRYHYTSFIGGILLLNKQLYETVDGLSNRYWGWGMEDDEFYLRLTSKRINVRRPSNVSTNSSNTFRHIHGSKRKRDHARCFNQARVNFKRDHVTGLHNVKYQISKIHQLRIDDNPVTVVNVNLNCNRTSTPWCSCDSASKS